MSSDYHSQRYNIKEHNVLSLVMFRKGKGSFQWSAIIKQ